MISYVPIGMIADGKYQKREEYGDIVELARSIASQLFPHLGNLEAAPRRASYGLLQLPQVRVFVDGELVGPDIGRRAVSGEIVGAVRAELLFGHRRTSAIKWLTAAGKRSADKIAKELDIERDEAFRLVEMCAVVYDGRVPCEVVTMTDEEAFLATWTENTHRKETTAVEDAAFILQAREIWDGETMSFIADKLNISRSRAQNLARIETAPEWAKQMNKRGELNGGQLEEIVTLKRLAEHEDRQDNYAYDVPLVTQVLESIRANPDAWPRANIRAYLKRLGQSADPVWDRMLDYKLGGISDNCKPCPARIGGGCVATACNFAKRNQIAKEYAGAAGRDGGIAWSDDHDLNSVRIRENSTWRISRLLAQKNMEEIAALDDRFRLCFHGRTGAPRPFKEPAWGYGDRPNRDDPVENWIAIYFDDEDMPDFLATECDKEEAEAELTERDEYLESWRTEADVALARALTNVRNQIAEQIRKAVVVDSVAPLMGWSLDMTCDGVNGDEVAAAFARRIVGRIDSLSQLLIKISDLRPVLLQPLTNPPDRDPATAALAVVLDVDRDERWARHRWEDSRVLNLARTLPDSPLRREIVRVFGEG